MHAPRLRSRKLALGSAAAIAVTGAVAFTGIAVTQTASAGTNGQQIALCADQGVTSTNLSGTNENGQVVNVVADVNNLVKGMNDCYELRGHWWKGNVTLHWTFVGGSGSDSSGSDSVCSVPVSADGDITYCTY